MPLISVCVFSPIFFFLIKNGMQRVWHRGLWWAVIPSPWCKIHYWIKGCSFLSSFGSSLSKQFWALTSLLVSFGLSAEWKCGVCCHWGCILNMAKWACRRVWNICSRTPRSGTWSRRQGRWAPDFPCSRKELGQLGLWGRVLIFVRCLYFCLER